ncbi:MAG: glycoside hydrolase family 5 protein [Calditrichaeota bacterium]|nr:MAG: glycoside hydrolase family 5 protein [Calditrichota bacterium]MBL1206973.1 glycoside hydrolase family 5 protein [Calditrichota bacterium]NOG46800.1 glycoside hydrolase family 5 protein [Calditrichota bacterium]
MTQFKFLIKALSFILISLSITFCSNDSSNSPESDNPKTVVELLGKLQTQGNQIVDKNGDPIALHGMSMFWSQWAPKFYNKDCIQWLYNDWKCTIIRAALAVEEGGYLENPQEELAKIETVVEACIDLGIYVIIDWHNHHAEQQPEVAKAFFKQMAQKYGGYPNVIYEIYNEPLNISWSQVLKPYSEAVIAEIRSEDPDNLIIVGTPNWSQDVDVAALDPIDDVNVAYSLHYYTGTHRQELRNKAQKMLDKNLPIFVTEWGVSQANALGNIDYEETQRWLYFADQNNLSWCTWSVNDKEETTSIVKPGSSPTGNWSEADLTEAGTYVKSLILERNAAIFELLENE